MNNRQTKRLLIRQELASDPAYITLHTISRFMDTYYFDPIIGLVPVIGDILSAVVVAPYIYVAFYRIKSIPLTLAVISNVLVDVLVGVIPYLGIVLDAVNKAHLKNCKLITGFVEGDEHTISEVNRKALGTGVMIAVLIVLIYFAFKFVGYLLELFWGLFS